jgi:hypothetical protein
MRRSHPHATAGDGAPCHPALDERQAEPDGQFGRERRSDGCVTTRRYLMGQRAWAVALLFACLLGAGIAPGARASTDETRSAVGTAELWDPIAGTFESTGAPLEARYSHTATLLSDGRVLVTGGIPASGSDPLATAEIWDPATGAFEMTGPMATGRSGHSATLLPDGRVLVIGGEWALADDPDVTRPGPSTAEVWDPASGTFESMPPMIHRYPWGHSAALLNDGRVLIVGPGEDATDAETTVPQAEMWDPSAGAFVLAAPPDERYQTDCMVTLDDGRALLVGDAATYLHGAELWDPAIEDFERTGAPSEARFGKTVTLLGEGDVLVLGGESLFRDPREVVASGERWDAASGAFRPGAQMTMPRIFHEATLLSDGRLLVTGGETDPVKGDSMSTAEVWDPHAGVFEVTGAMSTGRSRQTATLLRDGRVLVVGGLGSGAGG